MAFVVKCKACGLPVVEIAVAGVTVATDPITRDHLYLLAERDGLVICEGLIRGDIGDSRALRAIHRKHECGDARLG